MSLRWFVTGAAQRFLQSAFNAGPLGGVRQFVDPPMELLFDLPDRLQQFVQLPPHVIL